MGTASKYWKLVSLDVSGKRKIEEVISAKEFFQQQFPELVKKVEVQDTVVQRHLLELTSKGSKIAAAEEKECLLAESCLRCFISHQIEQVCIQLEVQFGREYGFTRYDLFCLVLDDTGANFPDSASRRTNQRVYQPVSVKILATFDPQKASLSTWTTRLIKQNRELNTFLLEHGVYLVSNWAILNDTTPKQLRRIGVEFHNLTSAEIEQACFLLESYHAIYRRDRLRQRQAGVRERCQPPSREQMQQIANLLHQKANLTLSPEETMSQLQELAELLRQYRIHVRGGKSLAQSSLDNPEVNVDRWYASMAQSESEEGEEEPREFLQFYRQQFLECLDESIKYVIQTRLNYLNRKKSAKAQHFLRGLSLFHCQGKSMSEIASVVGLKAQFQVSRLLKLKEFRADIRQKMLSQLRELTLVQAAKYAIPQQLKQLEQQVEIALEEQITALIQEAEAEASTANNSYPSSLFAQRLCRYLDLSKNELLAHG